ncbi:hypothetical protein N8D56_26630 (plasmid) [Devosia sp. A8/3-2]|nr:hypothetical protein N8D56_26630 [Devosia sp. A8/3-2]
MSRGLIHRIEKGDLGASVGAAFEVASVVGCPCSIRTRDMTLKVNEARSSTPCCRRRCALPLARWTMISKQTKRQTGHMSEYGCRGRRNLLSPGCSRAPRGSSSSTMAAWPPSGSLCTRYLSAVSLLGCAITRISCCIISRK